MQICAVSPGQCVGSHLHLYASQAHVPYRHYITFTSHVCFFHLTCKSGGGEEAAKPVTPVQDCVLTFSRCACGEQNMFFLKPIQVVLVPKPNRP